MVWKRVKQVVAALTARIEAVDRQFVAYHLTIPEASLFWRMNTPDQRHALNVAHTVLELWADFCKEQEKSADFVTAVAVKRRWLLKAALLHDVGKVKGDVSTLDKIIAVLADRLCPATARRWGRMGRGNTLDNLRHALYIYYHHANRSGDMLVKCGTEDAVVDMVRKHHQLASPEDSPELLLLRQADDRH